MKKKLTFKWTPRVKCRLEKNKRFVRKTKRNIRRDIGGYIGNDIGRDIGDIGGIKIKKKNK